MNNTEYMAFKAMSRAYTETSSTELCSDGAASLEDMVSCHSSSDSETSEYEEPLAMCAVRKCLERYEDIVQRWFGNQLKINKYHQQLHNVRQILKDGSLLNVNGG